MKEFQILPVYAQCAGSPSPEGYGLSITISIKIYSWAKDHSTGPRLQAKVERAPDNIVK